MHSHDAKRFLAAVGTATLTSVSATAAAFDAPPAPVGVIAEGTRWATPYFMVEGIAPGPTVMVIGGVHGDEKAGAAAADEIKCWPIARGKLVIIPRANVPALARGTRLSPKTTHADLNRNFPRHADDLPRGTMARALWAAILATKPELIVDLHEGFDFHKRNKKSVGSSVLYYPSTRGEQVARRLVRAVNATVSKKERRFALLRPPAPGSLARAVTERLNIPAMILETTKNEQPLSVRIEQHHLMVTQLLMDLGMLRHGALTDALVSAGDVPLSCADRATLAASAPPGTPAPDPEPDTSGH